MRRSHYLQQQLNGRSFFVVAHGAREEPVGGEAASSKTLNLSRKCTKMTYYGPYFTYLLRTVNAQVAGEAEADINPSLSFLYSGFETFIKTAMNVAVDVLWTTRSQTI